MVILWNSLLLIIKEIYGFNKNIYLLVFFFWKWYYTVEIYEKGSSKLKSRAEEKNNRLRMENVNGKKEETLKKMLKDVDDDKKREEIIHMLLEQKVSKIVKEEEKDKKNFSNKLSDFIGSKKIIYSMGIFILIWGIINIFFLVAKKFNPYSFVVLNVILSFFMFIFCSLIIFNQNKMKKLDEKKSENDYKVNLKNEIIIEDLHYKLDDLIEKQDRIAIRVLDLEKKKKSMTAKGTKEYKFIDISEGEKKNK